MQNINNLLTQMETQVLLDAVRNLCCYLCFICLQKVLKCSQSHVLCGNGTSTHSDFKEMVVNFMMCFVFTVKTIDFCNECKTDATSVILGIYQAALRIEL